MAVPDAIARILDPLSIDRLLKLQQLVQQRAVVPYVGAGMSVCAGLPTWSQFCEAVALQAPASGRERVPQNWPFAKMLERYAEAGWLADFIANQFDRDLAGIDLRSAPIALLRGIRPSFVVTTNYDRLLEHVLAGSVGDVFTGSEIDPRVYWNVLRVSDSDKTFILKLHGSSDLENGLVATHRQYQEAYHRPGKLPTDCRHVPFCAGTTRC